MHLPFLSSKPCQPSAFACKDETRKKKKVDLNKHLASYVKNNANFHSIKLIHSTKMKICKCY